MIQWRVLSLLKKLLIYLEAYLRLGQFHVNERERDRMLSLALRYIHDEKGQGNYFEFGVADGKTFISAILLAKKYKLNLKFCAFDSFQGFPDTLGIDSHVFERFKQGDASYPKRELVRKLKRARIRTECVDIIEGWFAESMTPELQEQYKLSGGCAIAWVDCDLYKSTVPVLDFLFPLIHQGTVLIFDDWYCFRGSPILGEQRAVGEWVAKHPNLELIEFRKFGVVGNSFIVSFKD